MFDLQLVSISGSEALKELQRLRERLPTTGLYPVLMGDEEDVEQIKEGMEATAPVTDIIQESLKIDAAAWIQQQYAEADEMYVEEGEWPDDEADAMPIITHQNILTGEPKPQVQIALLKASASCEAFAYLNWGNWNDCPSPEVHCAMHRYWHRQYGTEVISITRDVVQCVVTRPPTSRDAALALAKEQYIYCCDIVDQGTQTLNALAASLLNGKYWYFWWD